MKQTSDALQNGIQIVLGATVYLWYEEYGVSYFLMSKL